jgi:hypothetical protein
MSTGRNTIPAGQQSQWSQALRASGALQDPRSNPIPFQEHPQSGQMFDPYIAATQGGSSAAPVIGGGAPAVGGVQPPPQVTPGVNMNSPAAPVQPPALGAVSPPPQVGAMTDPAQAQLMAGQMNAMLRKRYGGF